MTDFFKFIKNIIQSLPYINSPFMIKLVESIALIIIIWLIKILIIKVINKNISDIKTQYHWRKLINSTVFIIILILVGRIWFKGAQSLVTYLGLLSAGVAIALKDVLANLAGWLYIISRRPFNVGDRVQIGEFAGDVIDQSFFEFTLLEIGNWVHADQSTGRLIHIPNGKIFTQDLANYDKGFKYLWNEIEVVVTFESDWKKAKNILLDIANKKGEHITKRMENQIKRAAKKYMIYYKELKPIVYTSVVEHGVKLTIRHLCETRKRRGYTEALWEDILLEFAKNKNIDLAYPTTRFYKNKEE
ncbi:MAG: mechanosensitive ion channel [Candidatus Cloacimonetes bacterium]|jgi:small-conductance mechanosensitive channel|nr:mechanosensitive ion channel [Candidatus Cloacimonadota bacterium]